MDIKEVSKNDLLRDLAWLRDHVWICQIAVKYEQDYDFQNVPFEVATERVKACYGIIAKIVFEIVRRNNG